MADPIRPHPEPPSTPATPSPDGQPEQTDVGHLHAPIVREKLEPRDGFEPVPMWMVAAFGVLLFWGGWYMAMYNGGWRSDILDPDPAVRYQTTGDAAGKPVDPMVLGERLFKANCVSCHQLTGVGVPGQYPPLAGSEWVLEHPQRMKRIVLHGMEGPVVVKGSTYNGNMPAFAAKLNDPQLAAVLTYIRNSWGNAAGPIAPEAVAATREATKTRAKPYHPDELLALTEPDFVAPAAPPATAPASPSPPPASPVAP